MIKFRRNELSMPFGFDKDIIATMTEGSDLIVVRMAKGQAQMCRFTNRWNGTWEWMEGEKVFIRRLISPINWREPLYMRDGRPVQILHRFREYDKQKFLVAHVDEEYTPGDPVRWAWITTDTGLAMGPAFFSETDIFNEKEA